MWEWARGDRSTGAQLRIQVPVCVWGGAGWEEGQVAIEDFDKKCMVVWGMEAEAEALWLCCLPLGLEQEVCGASSYLWRPGSNPGGDPREALGLSGH